MHVKGAFSQRPHPRFVIEKAPFIVTFANVKIFTVFKSTLVLHHKIILHAVILIVYLQNLIFRIALRGDFACLADQLQDQLDVDLMCRTCGGNDVLFHHRAAEIIAAIGKRQLADIRPHRYP